MASVYESSFAIRQCSINASTWTDVQGNLLLPIDCNTVIIFNNTGVDIFLRSDPNKAASQVTIQAGQQFEIGSPGSSQAGGAARFPVGCSPVCALLSSAGNVQPLIESLK